jgi:2-dehydro-3-deoxy-D-pentonate aldolase
VLKGIFTPIITVFGENGEIDFEGNKRVIESILEAGVDGILFLGSIGEFFALTMEEKKKYIDYVIEVVNKRAKVLIGTGGTVIEEVIELTRYAEKAGADAACAISPYYFNLTEESLYQYYSKLAESSKLPLMLYNFPDRTGVNMSPELVAKLAKNYNNIIGIKDSVDNIGHTRKLIAAVKPYRKDFAVFSGFDEYLIPNLMAGGAGIIGGLTNIAPEIFVELYKCYINDEFEKVKKLQERANLLAGLYDVSQPFISAIKAAVSVVVPGAGLMPREPFVGVDGVQMNKVKEILAKAEVI